MMNLFVASINISPFNDAGTVFGQGGGRARKHKVQVLFCLKIAKHLYQPKMFNGRKVFAHSLVIRVEPTAVSDLGGFPAK